MLLAVVGLGIASVVTLGDATRGLVPGQPRYYLDRQAIYLIVGGLLMLAVSRLDYSRLRQLKNGIYALLMLSILAVLAAGHTVEGSVRAISLPFFSFQASELGKVLLILALSALVVDRARRLRERDTTARVLLAALIPAMFVIAQPDLGSGMVYMVIAFVLLLVAGTPGRQLAQLLALVAMSLTFVLVGAPAVGVHVLKPYQVERLTAFLHPSSNIKAIRESESKTGEPNPSTSRRSRRSRSAPGRRPAGARALRRCPSDTCRRVTPTSSLPRSASSTASLARGWCCACTRS